MVKSMGKINRVLGLNLGSTGCELCDFGYGSGLLWGSVFYYVRGLVIERNSRGSYLD